MTIGDCVWYVCLFKWWNWNMFWAGLTVSICLAVCYDRYITTEQENKHIQALVDSNRETTDKFEAAWMGAQTKYERAMENLGVDYSEAMVEQIRICDESLANREEIILAAERFGTVSTQEAERATRAEDALKEMVTLAKALKEEVKRLSYTVQSQLLTLTKQKETIGERSVEINFLWSTIHEARATVYRLNYDLDALAREIGSKQTIIDLLSSHLWMYEDVDALLNPPAPEDDPDDIIIIPADEVDEVDDCEVKEEFEIKLTGRYHRRSRTYRFFQRSTRRRVA